MRLANVREAVEAHLRLDTRSGTAFGTSAAMRTPAAMQAPRICLRPVDRSRLRRALAAGSPRHWLARLEAELLKAPPAVADALRGRLLNDASLGSAAGSALLRAVHSSARHGLSEV